jgi:hypothetical protein
MIDFIRDGGYAMYVLVAMAVGIVVMTIRAIRLLSSGEVVSAMRTGFVVDGVLFWGGAALVIGILGTTIGLSLMAKAVENFGAVSTALLWGGVRVALTTTIAGGIIFMASLLIWLPMRGWLMRRVDGGLLE